MRPPRNRTSLSSKKVRHCGPSRDKSGRKILPHREVLGPAGLVKKTLQARERQRVRLQGALNITFIFNSLNNTIYTTEMTPDERHALEALRELPLDDNDGQHMDLGTIVTVEDILDGSEPLDISHAGGEFSALTKELSQDLWNL